MHILAFKIQIVASIFSVGSVISRISSILSVGQGDILGIRRALLATASADVRRLLRISISATPSSVPRRRRQITVDRSLLRAEVMISHILTLAIIKQATYSTITFPSKIHQGRRSGTLLHPRASSGSMPCHGRACCADVIISSMPTPHALLRKCRILIFRGSVASQLAHAT